MLSKAEKNKNIMLYKNQSIFVIPASETEFIEDDFYAYTPKDKLRFWSSIDSKGKYVKRADVEGLNSLYQPIPYIVIINNDKILLHKFKNTEPLKTSIGFSDHIDLETCGYREVLFKACANIILNNLGDFLAQSSLEFNGFIKTFSKTTLGHLGYLFVLNVTDDTIIKSDKYADYEFVSFDDIKDKYYGSLEEWSKISFNHLYEKLISK